MKESSDSEGSTSENEDKIAMARLFLFYQVAVQLPSPEAYHFSCALKKK